MSILNSFRALSSVLLLLVFVFPIVVQGQSLDLPEDLLAYKSGYPQAPVMPCPLPQKKYEDMLKQLDGIKQKIKSEACPSKQIENIEKELKSLEDLITQGRPDFIDLIKKGTSGDTQLTPKEVTGLQNYVDSVVKTVASVTGLLNNPACFDEDEKVSSLSSLSSLIGEISGAIGALTGPFGAKISLGGKIASGLLSSIDTIVQARKTYDYEVYEDRRNYLYNLCAYYEFKSDLDKETDVFAYYDRLYVLYETSGLLIEKLGRDCSECQTVINDYTSRVISDEVFEVQRSKSRSYREITIGEPESFSASEGFESDFESKTADEMSDSELLDFYFDFSETEPEVAQDEPVNQPDPAIGSEGNLVDSKERIDLNDKRSLTIRALQANTWAEKEIASFKESDLKGLNDDARREVMRVQEQIEKFLFAREGVRYLNFYNDLLRKDYRRMEAIINEAYWRMGHLMLQPDPNYNYSKYGNELSDAVHDLFRDNHDFAELMTWQLTPEELREIIVQSRRQILEAMQPLRVDYKILNDRCVFFKNSLYKNRGDFAYTCERFDRILNPTKKFFTEIQATSFNGRYGSLVEFVNLQDDHYVPDWLASLTETFSQSLDL